MSEVDKRVSRLVAIEMGLRVYPLVKAILEEAEEEEKEEHSND